MDTDRQWGTYLERKARRKRQERAIHTSRAANARPSTAPSPPMCALFPAAPPCWHASLSIWECEGGHFQPGLLSQGGGPVLMYRCLGHKGAP